MSRSQWASFHLFRAESLNQFLNEAVAPFVTAALAERLASAFFFIRYWEGGPHIRLRFRTSAPKKLTRRTRSHFETYFKAHPSVRQFDSYGPASFPNDSVREITYEPEVARYGGEKGVAVSERQFEASSRAVLGAMADREWSYESAIGAALQLHIIFANTMGFDLPGSARFFADASKHFAIPKGWLPPNLSMEQVIGQFAALFAQQRERLVTLHQDIWSALAEDQEFEQEWANRWVRDNLDFARRFRRARGLAATEPWTSAERAIMMSYVHMTNNRLGVLNRDEAYVGYVLMRGFQEAV
jgi:thiopeptide-type bacteriocin biosynthesis protein